MGKKKSQSIKATTPQPPADRWASIERGEAKSAASTLYKPPSDEPKFIHPAKLAKPKKLFDGEIEERVLSHGKVGGAKKRKNLEKPRETSPNVTKKAKRILETPKIESVTSTKTSKVSQSYIVEDPDGEEVTIVANGAEETFKKITVDDIDFEGLESDDEDEEVEDEEVEDEEVEDEDVEDEDVEDEDVEDEEIEGEERGGCCNRCPGEEMDEDEIEVDETDFRINPEDIAEYISDEEDVENEDEEEVEDEEGVDDEEEVEDEEDEDEEEDEEEVESDVSELDAESDDEGFIAGKHRETHVIKNDHQAKKIDFDKFPFAHEDSVVSASRAFAFLISPCDVQTFFDTFYQSNVLVVHRKQEKYYGNLFSTQRLCGLLEDNHLEYGTNINIAQYKNGQRTTLNGKGRVYPQIVKQHLSNLCSVQLVNPQTFDDRIWYLCEVLQEQFGCFVGANTYLTPAGSSGFAPHWDEIDAFLLQVEGRKYWRVWAPESPEEELPIESSDNFTEDDMKSRKPVFEGWVEQGDMIYIPRGFIHQARTDKKVHSLHVTVSTGRQWSFANLMEKMVPEAIQVLTEQRMKMRRGLPIGMFDMGGVVDLDYHQGEHFVEKFKMVVDRHMSMLRNLVADDLLECSVDSMAKEFMKQALPPRLTDAEKKYSVIGTSTNLLGTDLIDFTAKTRVRLIRKHTQRLLMESEDTCFISHRMNNSRLFEGRPEEIVEFPASGIDVFRVLSNAYPEWRKLEDVFDSKETRKNSRTEKLAAIQKLFQIGVLLVKN